MPSRGLLSWPEGSGWLVLSGGDMAGSPLRAQALTRAIADGNVIYISLADDEGESLQEDMEDLGASAGYILNLEDEEDDAIAKQLKDASLIVIESGDNINALYRLMEGAVIDGLKAAYER